jgi:hypothetical protein
MRQQELTNFAPYIHQLCVELGSKDRTIEVRRLAGLQIKNAVDTRSEAAAQLLHNRWKALPEQARASIKGMLLQILQDEIKEVRNTAALVSPTRHTTLRTCMHVTVFLLLLFSLR